MATRKKTLTVAERHEQELNALRAAHMKETNELHALLARNERDAERAVRVHRQGAFWQGAFIIGVPSIVLGVVFGAVLTFSAVVQTLPVAYEQVARTALFQQTASDNVAERAAEILEEKRGAE